MQTDSRVIEQWVRGQSAEQKAGRTTAVSLALVLASAGTAIAWIAGWRSLESIPIAAAAASMGAWWVVFLRSRAKSRVAARSWQSVANEFDDAADQVRRFLRQSPENAALVSAAWLSLVVCDADVTRPQALERPLPPCKYEVPQRCFSCLGEQALRPRMLLDFSESADGTSVTKTTLTLSLLGCDTCVALTNRLGLEEDVRDPEDLLLFAALIAALVAPLIALAGESPPMWAAAGIVFLAAVASLAITRLGSRRGAPAAQLLAWLGIRGAAVVLTDGATPTLVLENADYAEEFWSLNASGDEEHGARAASEQPTEGAQSKAARQSASLAIHDSAANAVAVDETSKPTVSVPQPPARGQSRVQVGVCSACGRPLRVKPQAVRDSMRLTCKCGQSSTVKATPDSTRDVASGVCAEHDATPELVREWTAKLLSMPVVSDPERSSFGRGPEAQALRQTAKMLARDAMESAVITEAAGSIVSARKIRDCATTTTIRRIADNRWCVSTHTEFDD